MAKYRKRPVIIEAVQWHKLGDHPAVLTPTSCPRGEPLRPLIGGPECGWIRTLEGPLIVSPGDWIITGVQGEHYPCKPDIFDATYAPVQATKINFVPAETPPSSMVALFPPDEALAKCEERLVDLHCDVVPSGCWMARGVRRGSARTICAYAHSEGAGWQLLELSTRALDKTL